jgi:hypothetical protein|tara:strand:- start:478 stop:1158 length:681 start_codon:yes stop_codon:yes gene_type:complete
MPKKEKLVKKVIVDETGRRNVTWERQIVEENPVLFSETPLGIVFELSGRVYINGKETNGVRTCKLKEKVFSGDTLITKNNAKVVLSIPHEEGTKGWGLTEHAEVIVTEELLKYIREKPVLARVMKANGKSLVNGEIAKIGGALYEFDILETKSDGFLVVIWLDDKTVTKIRHNTRFHISNPDSNVGQTRSLIIDQGTTLHGQNYGKDGRKKAYSVETPVSVASIKG